MPFFCKHFLSPLEQKYTTHTGIKQSFSSKNINFHSKASKSLDGPGFHKGIFFHFQTIYCCFSRKEGKKIGLTNKIMLVSPIWRLQGFACVNIAAF
jgi:hypothetical protein